LPIDGANILLIDTATGETWSAQTQIGGTFSFQISSLEILLGDQMMFEISYTDDFGNSFFITSCKIRSVLIGESFVFEISRERVLVATARWENYGNSPADGEDYGDTLELITTFPVNYGIKTISTDELEIYLTYSWDDNYIFTCDTKVIVNIYIQLHVGLNYIIGTVDEDDDGSTIAFEYERIDMCGDENDGARFTSDPNLNWYVTNIDRFDSFEFTIDSTMTVDWDVFEYTDKGDGKDWYSTSDSGMMIGDKNTITDGEFPYIYSRT
jgi:hypothetical protein